MTSSYIRPLYTVIVLALMCPFASAAEDYVAFVNTNVVDVENAQVLADRTVIVRGEHISGIVAADTPLPAGVTVINATGRYLAPGLMDMHTHIATPDDLALALGYGVTTVRVMWGNPGTLELRAKVASGELPGPRIVSAGDLMDGHPAIWASMGLEANEYTDPAAMDAAIAAQKAAGYDFIKTYSRLTPEVFLAIIEAGKKHDIEVSGHVPQDVPFKDAVTAGMRTSEHLIGVMHAAMGDDSLPSPDLAPFDERALELVESVGRGEVDVKRLLNPDKVAELATFIAGHDHWLVPTHDVMRNFTNNYQQPFPDALRYMSPTLRATFDSIADGSGFSLAEDQRAGETTLYSLRSALLGALHLVGAKIMVGTDHSLMSGPAVHQEIKALHDVGLSNAAAIRAATSVPGEYLARFGLSGVVADGAQADLVLLRANPLEDLAALKAIDGVMARGRWHDRAALDVLLDGVAARAATPAAEEE